MFDATVLTLFPDMFPGPLGQSLAGDAMMRGVWSLEVQDIRAHGLGKHRAVDDTPGGQVSQLLRGIAHAMRRATHGRRIGWLLCRAVLRKRRHTQSE